MLSTYIEDHADRAAFDNLPAMFQGKPKITALCRVLGAECQALENAIQSVSEKLLIRNADGVWLEALESLVGSSVSGGTTAERRALVIASVIANNSDTSPRAIRSLLDALGLPWTVDYYRLGGILMQGPGPVDPGILSVLKAVRRALAPGEGADYWERVGDFLRDPLMVELGDPSNWQGFNASISRPSPGVIRVTADDPGEGYWSVQLLDGAALPPGTPLNFSLLVRGSGTFQGQVLGEAWAPYTAVVLSGSISLVCTGDWVEIQTVALTDTASGAPDRCFVFRSVNEPYSTVNGFGTAQNTSVGGVFSHAVKG